MNCFRLMQSVLAFTMLFLFSAHGFAEEGKQNSVEKEELWIWAEVGDKPDTIFFTRGSGESWQIPEQLSENEALNVVPAVLKLNNGKVFVAWSTYENGESKIYYRYETDTGWSEPAVYVSGLTQNMAPSLLVDKKGTLWLFFAGFNGLSDEIYYTTWKDGKFETAVAITSNDIPDILPVTGLAKDSGTIWVQWSQFSKDGYIKYQSRYEGSEWNDPQPVESVSEEENEDVITNDKAQKDETEFELVIPEVVTDVKSASVHIPGNEIQSLPVRSLDIVE